MPVRSREPASTELPLPTPLRIHGVTDPLTPAEREAWRAVLLVADILRFRVAAALRPFSDLSPADHSVLMRLVEAPEQRMGQQRLANEMFWSKSRLSRQLSRMQARGLVERTTDNGARGVQIVLTAEGIDAVRAAAPAHADAVRRYFLETATEDEVAAFLRLAGRLTDSAGTTRA
jgi:DNA-binding MarR family transcriptional regulator